MNRSIRTRLLGWVLGPLIATVGIDGWISYHNAFDTASGVQDRLLTGSAHIVAEQLLTSEGTYQQHIPPAALEIFDSEIGDRVYYRVTTDGGLIVSGDSKLDLPGETLQSETPTFYLQKIEGADVRVVAYLQPVVLERDDQHVLVEIGQSTHGRDRLILTLWLRNISQQILVLALVASLILLGLRQGLRPLIELKNKVRARSSDDFNPLGTEHLPTELTPLVQAINEYTDRLKLYTEAQSSFIQNAAHQLRTPLAILITQVNFARHTEDPALVQDSLSAIHRTTVHATRLANQLLSLSQAETPAQSVADARPTDLRALATQVLEELSGLAHHKQIDLGLDCDDQPMPVVLPTLAIREILSNLIHNAITYTPAGGVVTCKLHENETHYVLAVEDNGPGIPPTEYEHVFKRFYRLQDHDSSGSGLGLSIVKEFCTRINAEIALGTSMPGPGLTVTVKIPK
ncbi:MAG: sensor histidine kinase [Burkholderiaceae bacterium]|nr:sensor histidine kinase [Roseateles sp.]MBV8468693.1 sensor histidine kinase [Burkholderiaceae bacterium]